ncbi:MAG TPA: hypothetical protein VFS43_27525, partial [Polyangiaceae bacterium]|nr:hypothetical protein [Polyangiaceae bacterium]
RLAAGAPGAHALRPKRLGRHRCRGRPARKDAHRRTAAEERGFMQRLQRIRHLERELQRKDKALAEAAALLVLQREARSLWGDEGDDTPETNEP